MSYKRSGPSEYKELNTLEEAVSVMASTDAILRTYMEEHQIEVKTWYTNGDFAGSVYYTIPREVVQQLIPMTDGVPTWGSTLQNERTLSSHHRDKYRGEILKKNREEREKREAEEEKVRKSLSSDLLYDGRD